ncbi:uncharacterized protein LOC131891524 [Tigriopus californicus]|uniref:uncharacterized protein LOC131891524 n=1 Tax=Tigriopus californicus TaxID=6832 RepID=UPI0027DA49C3|nr:uncharacterized protein LOC131891524 [Tigriopus californicus]
MITFATMRSFRSVPCLGGLLVGAIIGVVSGQPTVKFTVWGNLILNAGYGLDYANVTCTATSDAPDGEFIWMIGEKTLDNSNPVNLVDPGTFSQVFKVKPFVRYNDLPLRCKYIEKDSSGQVLSEDEDKLMLKITKIDLPTKINAGKYLKGGPVELSFEFKVFPKPDEKDMFWVVRDMVNDTTKKYGLDTSMDGLEILPIMQVGDETYRTTLTINNASEIDAKKSYAFHIIHLKKERTVPITFSLDEEDDGIQPDDTVNNVIEISTIDPEVRGSEVELGIGLFVVLALIVLILCICIGFCMYKQCCKKSSLPPTSPRTTYSSVTQKDQV